MLKKRVKADVDEFGDYNKTKCRVDEEKCIGCRMCTKTGCPAIIFDKKSKKASINEVQCTGCEVCAQVCMAKAIKKVGE